MEGGGNWLDLSSSARTDLGEVCCLDVIVKQRQPRKKECHFLSSWKEKENTNTHSCLENDQLGINTWSRKNDNWNLISYN